MSLKISVALGLIFVFTVTLAFIARGDETKGSAADKLDGTWLPSSAELAGKKYPDEVRKAIKLVIKDDTYAVTVGQAPPDRGTLKLNPAANPKELDITGTEGPNKGKTILAIYERGAAAAPTGADADSDAQAPLRICYDLSGKSRPTEFKTAQGTQLFLVTYERAKEQ